MTLLATVFTTRVEMERKMGQCGILNYTDHDEDGLRDVDVLDDAINQATEEILLMANERYETADLATSNLIRRWATVLAVYFASYNRGNPPPESIIVEFERIMERLEKIRTFSMDVPGLAMKKDMAPAMSNRRIERRYEHRTVRTVKEASTGTDSELRTDAAWNSAYYPD